MCESEAGSGLNMLMSWYTYVDGKQYWVVANGATMTAHTGSGTGIPADFDADDVILTEWGDLTFTLLDDYNAVVSWESILPGFPDAAMDVTRLTQLSGYACE